MGASVLRQSLSCEGCFRTSSIAKRFESNVHDSKTSFSGKSHPAATAGPHLDSFIFSHLFFHMCTRADCYDCITGRVDIGGKRNVCPLHGCGVVLGPDPFEHGKLRCGYVESLCTPYWYKRAKRAPCRYKHLNIDTTYGSTRALLGSWRATCKKH